jgi:hypothetical protein
MVCSRPPWWASDSPTMNQTSRVFRCPEAACIWRLLVTLFFTPRRPPLSIPVPERPLLLTAPASSTQPSDKTQTPFVFLPLHRGQHSNLDPICLLLSPVTDCYPNYSCSRECHHASSRSPSLDSRVASWPSSLSMPDNLLS